MEYTITVVEGKLGAWHIFIAGGRYGVQETVIYGDLEEALGVAEEEAEELLG